MTSDQGLERDQDGRPIVTCRLVQSGRLAVIDCCPYCGEKHLHAAGADGHRLAHCLRKTTPEARRLGYVLRFPPR